MGELSNAPISDPHVPHTNGLQIGDNRLSTSCGVVEQPDHHCGDDLVLNSDIYLQPTTIFTVATGKLAANFDLILQNKLVFSFRTDNFLLDNNYILKKKPTIRWD